MVKHDWTIENRIFVDCQPAWGALGWAKKPGEKEVDIPNETFLITIWASRYSSCNGKEMEIFMVVLQDKQR